MQEVDLSKFSDIVERPEDSGMVYVGGGTLHETKSIHSEASIKYYQEELKANISTPTLLWTK